MLPNGEMGYQWGDHGKCYPSRKSAEAQARAAYASGYREKRAAEVQLTAPEVVQKDNPYHDIIGRFTDKENAVQTVGGLSALALYRKFDRDSISKESILQRFSAEDRRKISASIEEVRSLLDNKQHSRYVHARDKSKVIFYGLSAEGDKYNYTPDRLKLHKQLIDGILAGKVWNSATGSFIETPGFDPRPVEGQKPTLTILGGRGGSGKGNFDKGVAAERNSPSGVYDRTKAVVLDADAFKEMLARADGHSKIRNLAPIYHNESDDIFVKAVQSAKKKRLNIVLDLTLKSNRSKLVEAFKSSGYRVEGHYMHLPRDEAAISAVNRFKNGGAFDGRLVPVEVILANVNNEANFDSLKPHFDTWSVWSRASKLSKNGNPVLISKG